MKVLEHPGDDLLIQYLDGELPESQFVTLRLHLASCSGCRSRQAEFVRLSNRVEALVAAAAREEPDDSRVNLARALVGAGNSMPVPESPLTVMRRFGWAMAVAAALAAGIVLIPRVNRTNESVPVKTSPALASSTSIYVNGESFIALPYSNPDLPVNAPRIVEMQIPASSLVSAGLFLEPVANGGSDRTVLANVLLGLDGQPIGVHVLSAE
jgi:putative zinc finger protein